MSLISSNLGRRVQIYVIRTWTFTMTENKNYRNIGIRFVITDKLKVVNLKYFNEKLQVYTRQPYAGAEIV